MFHRNKAFQALISSINRGRIIGLSINIKAKHSPANSTLAGESKHASVLVGGEI